MVRVRQYVPADRSLGFRDEDVKLIKLLSDTEENR
jgi:hypothetical protein